MANILFELASAKEYGGQSSGIAKLGAGPALTPSSYGGTIDVIRDFSWTLSKSDFIFSEIPFIYLVEYRYLQNQFAAQSRSLAAGFADLASGIGLSNPSDPYQGLYDHSTPSYFSYVIPYFDDTAYDLNSSWSSIDAGLITASSLAGGIKAGITAGETAGAIETGGASILAGESLKAMTDIGAGLIDNIVKTGYLLNNPKVGIIDSPKLWKNSNERSYTIQFPLFNTNSVEDIQKNWELCYMLTYQNLFNKKTYFTAIPPVYYEVFIPGVHYSKASYISHLKIQNKGNIRNLRYDWSGKFQNYNIPDCYIVNITLTDLLMPSQNQMYCVHESKVTTNSYADQLASDIINSNKILSEDINIKPGVKNGLIKIGEKQTSL
jgi:hypothetical protein